MPGSIDKAPRHDEATGWSSTAISYQRGEADPPHHHVEGQLLFAARGVMLVETESDRWVIPPQRALWLLLSSQLIALFRVDPTWTEKYLLPFLDWRNHIEAKAVWEGFLWSPRLYQPLLTAFKFHFLDSANHYEDLGEHRQQYASLLTYAALGPTQDYTVDEFREAISILPQHGLEKIAMALYQALEGAGNQREDYWKNRILPLWRNIWPKSLELMTQQVSASLTQLVIATGNEFPFALREVLDWLQPIEHPNYAIHRLHESGLCKRFPAEVVVLLNAIISTANRRWLPEKFSCCLNEISRTAPHLKQDAGYLRLSNYYRKNNT